MKSHPPAPALVQGRDGVGPVAEAEAVEVLMLLVMPLVAGHRIVKRPGKRRQTQTLSTLNHPDSSLSVALVPNPLSPLAPQHQMRCLLSFFDAEVLKLLCANTNKNAKKNLEKGKKFAWYDITPQELTKYLGMLLFMSVCNLPKMTFGGKKAFFMWHFQLQSC